MPHFSIRRPVFAWGTTPFIALAGLITISQLAVARSPSVALYSVSITATFPGMVAENLDDAVGGLIERELSGSKSLAS